MYFRMQDVQGLNSPKPDIVCLHSLKNEKAAEASIPVMKDIQWTSFENAKRLVQTGAAQVRWSTIDVSRQVLQNRILRFYSYPLNK